MRLKLQMNMINFKRNSHADIIIYLEMDATLRLTSSPSGLLFFFWRLKIFLGQNILLQSSAF